ncbi:4a-hydroxytetrahydrobiopterin dehydratase [Glycomyces tenuis]|uniref:4a-hydroxytetrahydrobiopterin dehydratase n=1 Tax=Glycomyces tenuis TaxID=58116 RepID=UPI000689F241|nr:4a-hydroxytetrahydrobiopterin dehydratase [Glycomyces tenuis]
MGRTEQDDNVLLDALRELNGWEADDGRLARTLPLDESQHAALAEQIKIFADTLNVRPDVTRSEQATLIVLSRDGGVSLTDVTFAGRVESAYITIAGELAAQEHAELAKGRFARWRRRNQ